MRVLWRNLASEKNEIFNLRNKNGIVTTKEYASHNRKILKSKYVGIHLIGIGAFITINIVCSGKYEK